MRLLMVGPYPQSPERIDGGVSSALTYLSAALAREPEVELHGVRIVTGRGNPRAGNGFGWPITDLPLGRMSLSTLYLRQKLQFANLVTQFQPDIVHAQGADVAGYVAVSCGVPAVVTIHGLLAECARFQTRPTAKLRAILAAGLTERHTVRRAKHVIAISPYVARYYGDDIRGRIYEIENAVAPGFFRVLRKPERGRFLYAGRISNGKGLFELLEAVARNQEVVSQLVLAGATQDESYKARLTAEAYRLGITGKVKFTGLLDDGALFQEFSRATALVLPSHQETAPMVVQQAMAAGLPVIATTVGGIPYQLDHGVTGWLFQPGDVSQLAALVGKAATDQAEGAHLGEAAKCIAMGRFRASAVADATMAVYRGILEAPNVDVT